MFRGGYERLPMYASSQSTPRLRSFSSITRNDGDDDDDDTNDHSIYTPTTKPRSRHPPKSNSLFNLIRPRTLFIIIKFALPLSLAALVVGFILYEPHIELAFYSRKWIKQEIDPVPPLAGCFDPARVSEKYNLSDVFYGTRTHELHAGMPLRMGLDCYDFAGTIQGSGEHYGSRVSHRTQFHTYWRTDLAPFGPRQEWMLKSFFATQNPAYSQLILWSNGDLGANLILKGYVNRYPESFVLRVVNISELAVGTALDGSKLLKSTDTKAWVDGDLLRLLLLWTHGGVWVDMDSLLTRDLDPLLEHEFVTQWDCYGTHSFPSFVFLLLNYP
jgi:hypothetical protein